MGEVIAAVNGEVEICVYSEKLSVRKLRLIHAELAMGQGFNVI